MDEKVFKTTYGNIHYWISRVEEDKPWLVFLSGLTADYHLFDKQIDEFVSQEALSLK